MGLLRCAALVLHPLQSILLRCPPSGSPELPGCECRTPQRSSWHGKSVSLQGETSPFMVAADKELWREVWSSDNVGSAADFSCRCGTAVTWRFLPPSGIIQSSTRCLQLNTLARPWHVPSRHPHQSHRGLPGPSPAATSRQLVQTWREMTAEHPALLWGSRGCLGCVLGATAGWETPSWDRGRGACETSVPVKLGSCSLALPAFNCFVPASLCRWSLPPCSPEPRQRGMKPLWR